MTNERRVLVHPDTESLAASVAARFITKTVDILDDQGTANVVLTGGRVGTAVLAAINASPARDTVDWSRVSFWWGDERWLPAGDADRNDQQAREALLDHIERSRPRTCTRSRRPTPASTSTTPPCSTRRSSRPTRRRARLPRASTSPSSVSDPTATSPRCSRTAPASASRTARSSPCATPPSRRRSASA